MDKSNLNGAVRQVTPEQIEFITRLTLSSEFEQREVDEIFYRLTSPNSFGLAQAIIDKCKERLAAKRQRERDSLERKDTWHKTQEA